MKHLASDCYVSNAYLHPGNNWKSCFFSHFNRTLSDKSVYDYFMRTYISFLILDVPENIYACGSTIL